MKIVNLLAGKPEVYTYDSTSWSTARVEEFCDFVRTAYPLHYTSPTFAYMRHWWAQRIDGAGFMLNHKKFNKVRHNQHFRKIVKQYEIAERARARIGA